ncbi:hypothetical protein SG4_50 [Mycobacterium phage SG4]|uniref:Uncharacterized protein n=1 Tax=Mycobacterium phage SG4 TaxID=2923001 RepID=G8I9R6_9CAUD|nr:hypothetical protein CL94_gp050 [Mycobacterium phage SG4]AER49460.1 hypothetical protein SG4_50 [Mycobacterium phage SG4]QGJ89556.1 hypothetical protein PBI_ENBY_54 [Mycobacterium phage Enby]
MNLVERLNARFNNVIHDGLALVGAVVDPWLAKLERQAMSNALGRDISMDYGDVLVAVEAGSLRSAYMTRERDQADFSGLVLMSVVAALDGSPWVTKGHLRELSSEVAAVAVERMSETDSFFLPDGTLFEKRDSDTAECELLAEDICDEAEEAELLDEFMELGEFLDSATAEELAAMRQQHATAAELERHLRYFTTVPGASGVNPGVVAQSLLENYRITPR